VTYPKFSDLKDLGYSQSEANNFLTTLSENPIPASLAWSMARYEGNDVARPVPKLKFLGVGARVE